MSTENYTLGRGELWFGKFKPGTQVPDGFRFLGNVPAFNINVTSEKLEHFRSTRGVREKDLSITTQTNRTATITLEDISQENLALFFLGDTQIVTQGILATQTETFTDTAPGHLYQIGVTDARPTGHRKLTTVVVKVASVTHVLGTDYTLDADRGTITILEDGAIASGDDVIVEFGVAASSRTQVVSGSDSAEGAFKYVAFPAYGAPIDYFFPFVEMSPNGDHALIAENALQTIPLTVDIQTKGTQAAVYADGAAYIA